MTALGEPRERHRVTALGLLGLLFSGLLILAFVALVVSGLIALAQRAF